MAPEYKVSESSERAVLKKQGLLAGPGRSPLRAVLDRSWRCPDRRCKVYPASKGSGALLPSINQRGRATCEFHGLELIDDGPRLATAQVKVLVDGACVARFTVADGTSVAVGRSPGDGISLASWLAGDEERRISRVHLVLTFHDGTLFVRDQSTNGTWLAGRGRTGPAERLRKDRDYRVGPGDVVSIPAPITLTRSGRMFSSRLYDRDPRLTPPRGSFAEVRPTDLF